MSKKKNNKQINRQTIRLIVGLVIAVIIAIETYYNFNIIEYIDNLINPKTVAASADIAFDIDNIPQYEGKPYVIINDNKPYFDENEYTTESFEKYSELDNLGRCGVAYANICQELMPPDGVKRGSISSVYPSGWKNREYNGEYLYNRCHLIRMAISVGRCK